MKHMLALLVVLLVQKIGFMANDAVTPLLLIEKGFKREDMALTVLLDFPCQLVLGYLVAKWSTGTRPTRPWMYALVLRLIM
jgi:PAT family acetyl-CoA transporter-like MFS transporter 1